MDATKDQIVAFIERANARYNILAGNIGWPSATIRYIDETDLIGFEQGCSGDGFYIELPWDLFLCSDGEFPARIEAEKIRQADIKDGEKAHEEWKKEQAKGVEILEEKRLLAKLKAKYPHEQ